MLGIMPCESATTSNPSSGNDLLVHLQGQCVAVQNLSLLELGGGIRFSADDQHGGCSPCPESHCPDGTVKYPPADPQSDRS